MDIFAPTYYKNFKCISNKCKHNCCIGWEIDIDEASLCFYKKHSDIISKIDLEPTPHFVLEENDRCPFLNGNNLCEIIINHGENALCQICSDHPRFNNYFDTRTETGIGLTCEAAVKLILDNDFCLVKLSENNDISIENLEEDDFFEYRNLLFSKDIKELKKVLPNISLSRLAEYFKRLERLDNNWDTLLNTLKNRNEKIADVPVKEKEKAQRLFCYFLFRHLYDYGLAFCLLCTYFIISIDYDIYETARMFSSEIEYSDENIEKLLEILNA